MQRYSIPRVNYRTAGQGMVEYAGAMLIAALIVASLVTGAQTNNWMYQAYVSIFNASGNMMINAINTL